ncbi:unnamed protein product [Trichogramma brassicae]|uniref:CCHC-type domain-containing protein n=1 Tax=Trichogramma brassicae TaxID=86971 RepID=A0A6H5HX76_9HYME|nr:unnamed protein product [Trichogramma brassicae]
MIIRVSHGRFHGRIQPNFRSTVIFIVFLERRVQSLEQARPSAELAAASGQSSRDRGTGHRRISANTARVDDAPASRPGPLCDICQTGHWLHKCYKFLSMSQQQRLELCKAKRLCLNCLHKSHFVDKCPSASRVLSARPSIIPSFTLISGGGRGRETAAVAEDSASVSAPSRRGK